jgi:carbonic anhydrase
MSVATTQQQLANEALERLLQGNRRFAAGQPAHPDQQPAHRAALVAGQHPLAAILGCSDSRVPPELVFDQGLGALFTIRTAGHVADYAALGSLEFAVERLGVPLIVVLGHSHCGAVQATMGGMLASGAIMGLLAAIQPAVWQAELDAAGKRDVDRAVRLHVTRVVGQLGTSGSILARRVMAGQLTIVGGHYDLASGVVELIT